MVYAIGAPHREFADRDTDVMARVVLRARPG